MGTRSLAFLTYSADPEEEASVAEIVFGCFVLFRPPQGCQLLSDRTPIGQGVAWKILESRYFVSVSGFVRHNSVVADTGFVGEWKYAISQIRFRNYLGIVQG